MSDEPTPKPKHRGSENLIPSNLRSEAELREMTRRGGIKSGEVRREKKRMSEIYAGFLSKKFKIKNDDGTEAEISGSEMVGDVVAKIVQKADGTSVSMIKELREGVDGNLLDVEVLDLTKGMTYEEKRKRIGEILANRSRTQGD